MTNDDAETGPAQLPTVQLRHELPDGTSHIDWLLARDPYGREPLISFRLDGPLHQLREGRSAVAIRIGDHRPAYLDYEGPVSGDRGRVKRIARGRIVTWRKPDESRWELQIDWEDVAGTSNPRFLCLSRQDLDHWMVILGTQTG